MDQPSPDHELKDSLLTAVGGGVGTILACALLIGLAAAGGGMVMVLCKLVESCPGEAFAFLR